MLSPVLSIDWFTASPVEELVISYGGINKTDLSPILLNKVSLFSMSILA